VADSVAADADPVAAKISMEEHSPCTATCYFLPQLSLLEMSHRFQLLVMALLLLDDFLLALLALHLCPRRLRDAMSITVSAFFVFFFNTGFGTTVLTKISIYTVTSLLILWGALGVILVILVISSVHGIERSGGSQHQSGCRFGSSQRRSGGSQGQYQGTHEYQELAFH
jgi:hypothetical protein